MIKSKASKIGDIVVVFICVLIIIVCLLPLLNILARSLSSVGALMRKEVILWPVEINVDAYAAVLKDSRYTWSLLWTAMLTVACTGLSLFMTVICAYPLTYDHLKGRKIFNTLIILTMYFSAGTIPYYMTYKALGMIDSPWVLIIPNCLSVFNMIIMRSFLYGIPESLRESAELDGAGPIRVLWSIYLPLSTSVLATLALFYAVGRWNGYSDSLIYMSGNRNYYPIQHLLYQLLKTTTSVELDPGTPPGMAESARMATVMFATIPILLVYPWLQKYFIAGVTLGAVKG
ncbi:MAG: carbohydrate ABC transporter permease [Oscillospiraceae bacterium]|jgi:putative aldouronate transport system permease protein|nr:carbohydrate ABC transporter permease [Oscillospiraceae bacterium]